MSSVLDRASGSIKAHYSGADVLAAVSHPSPPPVALPGVARDTGDPRRTRAFAAGAFSFAVDADHADDRQAVVSLLDDMPPADGGDVTVFTLARQDTSTSTWTLGGPYVGGEPAPTLANALDRLQAAVTMCALDAEPEHLHLHAAAATKDGRAVILAAEANAGKTTTVAHLVQRGWHYVTDESVRLSSDTTEITGLLKPMSIKPGGEHMVAHLTPWMVPTIDSEAGNFRFAPVGASGATIAAHGVPQLVVLLRRDSLAYPSGPPGVQQIHPADAVVAMMGQTFDAERFGSAALQLARLAASCHCFELTIGTLDETVDTVEALFALGPAVPLDVHVLPASPAVSPGVVTVAIGDRAVVHDTGSGSLFALDAGATHVWMHLGGWRVDDGLDLDTPMIGPFLTQLRALGVLAGAA